MKVDCICVNIFYDQDATVHRHQQSIIRECEIVHHVDFAWKLNKSDIPFTERSDIAITASAA